VPAAGSYGLSCIGIGCRINLFMPPPLLIRGEHNRTIIPGSSDTGSCDSGQRSDISSWMGTAVAESRRGLDRLQLNHGSRRTTDPNPAGGDNGLRDIRSHAHRKDTCHHGLIWIADINHLNPAFRTGACKGQQISLQGEKAICLKGKVKRLSCQVIIKSL